MTLPFKPKQTFAFLLKERTNFSTSPAANFFYSSVILDLAYLSLKAKTSEQIIWVNPPPLKE